MLFATSADEWTRRLPRRSPPKAGGEANPPELGFGSAPAGSTQVKGSPWAPAVGGQTQWVWRNPLPQGNSLTNVSFSDANTGTTVGDFGTIIRTTDGGQNWIIQTSGTTVALNAVFFTDANSGTIVGVSGTILRTTDGGNTWLSQTSGTTNEIWGVFFTDANTGTAVGVGDQILRTTNGGTTWVSQPIGAFHFLRGVFFTDANTGTAVGDGGTILRTTD